MTLRPSWQAFADTYLAQPTGARNATDAYLVAFPKAKNRHSARVRASRLMAKPGVARYIEHMQANIETNTRLAMVSAVQKAAAKSGYQAEHIILDLIETVHRAMGRKPVCQRRVKQGKAYVMEDVYRISYADALTALERLERHYEIVPSAAQGTEKPGATVNIAVLPATATPAEWLRLHSPSGQ